MSDHNGAAYADAIEYLAQNRCLSSGRTQPAAVGLTPALTRPIDQDHTMADSETPGEFAQVFQIAAGAVQENDRRAEAARSCVKFDDVLQ